MSAAMLEPDELDAIRAAIQQAQPSVPTRGDDDARTIAIIADDRAAERGRPNGLRLAGRWARQVERHLARLTGAKLAVSVAGVESIEGAAMRSDTADGWLAAVRGDDGDGIVSVTGGLIEGVVARLLGDPRATVVADRAPSMVARRLFAPAGQAVVAALIESWRDELGARLAPAEKPDDWRHGIGDADLVLVVTLAVTSPPGAIRLCVRPELLAGQVAAPAGTAAPTAAIESALGEVPVDVEVELGRARLKMAELRALVIGQVIPLERLVDEPVPITVGGVVKAKGTPLLHRGAVAVEITTVLPEKKR